MFTRGLYCWNISNVAEVKSYAEYPKFLTTVRAFKKTSGNITAEPIFIIIPSLSKLLRTLQGF